MDGYDKYSGPPNFPHMKRPTQAQIKRAKSFYYKTLKEESEKLATLALELSTKYKITMSEAITFIEMSSKCSLSPVFSLYDEVPLSEIGDEIPDYPPDNL